MKSRTVRRAGHVACMGVGRKVYKVLVGKPERKRLLRKLRHRWKDGIKVDLREIGCEGMEWIHLPQDRDCWWAIVNTVMNPWVLAPHS
jgi:hypothetical protein